MAADSEQEFLVVLGDHADLGGVRDLPTKADKTRFVFERLTEAARRAQGPLLAELDAMGVPHQSFWITNAVRVKGGRNLVELLARRDDVARIAPNRPFSARLPLPYRIGPEPGLGLQSAEALAASPEWNIVKIAAPSVWAAGTTGQGVVVAGADTGYDWTHPALKSKYRGWNGTSADHNYNWHDAIHKASPGNACKSNAKAPCDDDSHGTHTMGIMVGDGGSGNQIGVAPGARWIGCRNMDEGTGTPARYIECFQFFLAPTDLNDANPDPAKAPDVINNSWDCPPSEGCTDPAILKGIIETVRAAGIAVVVAGGNEGPACNSMDVPEPYEASLSVGATDSNDAIASYSSRGPGDGGIIKPEIVAPGTGIRSSMPGGGYATMTGTSMASPHAAGMAALLLSASPALSGNVTGLQVVMEETAVPKTTTETCGGVAVGVVPNNTAGYGRIDALAGFNAAVAPNVPPSVALTSPADGATFTAFATISLTATASDVGGHVSRVDFFAGAVKLATVTSAPYTYVWSPVGAGSYVLTAVATDNQGASTASAPVSITVNPGSALPSPWVEGDVGAVGLSGSASYASGTFSVNGSGHGIGGVSDQFHFVYRALAGDGQVVARILSVEDTGLVSKGGVMIRESLTTGSPEASMLVTGTARWMFMRRLTADGSSSYYSGSATTPRWVKLVRSGNTVSGYRSSDGVAWALSGSVTIAMSSNVLIGLVMTSGSSSILGTAQFDNVLAPPSVTPTPTVSVTSTPAVTATATRTPSPTPTPSLTPLLTPTSVASTLPSPWVEGDVGAVGLSGSASYASGTFSVNGSGHGIGGVSDQFHFVYRALAGDGQVVARILSVEDTGLVSKGGVMIRESLTTGSPEASMLVTGTARWMFMRRLTADGSSSYYSGSATTPRWVKLVRSGNTVSGYRSSDGVAWALSGSVTIAMSSNVLIGLVMTSGSSSILGTAQFDNVVS